MINISWKKKNSGYIKTLLNLMWRIFAELYDDKGKVYPQ